MWTSYNRFRRFCAFIIGAVFFLGGLLKLMDPVGTGLIMAEYYKFLHLDFLDFSSKFVGEALALFETFLGLALMTGLWRRVIAVITFITLGLFTLLTFAQLILNPEMDCGCFGEAIHLTHFQSFIKNIILCGLSLFAFIPLGKLGRPKKKRYVCFGILSVFVAGFAIYSLLYIPLIDFTDFEPGARLEAGIMNSNDVYKATFIYEKDGVEKNFTLEHLPDSTWTYVRTETAKIENSDDRTASLPFSGRDGEDCDRLATRGSVLVFSIYDVESMSKRQWSRLAEAMNAAQLAGCTPLVLAATDSNDSGIAALDNMYIADYKALMTMNRSNGGATYFQNGILVRKWANRNLPDESKLALSSGAEAVETAAEVATRRNLACQGFFVLTLAILFFI